MSVELQKLNVKLSSRADSEASDQNTVNQTNKQSYHC